MTLVSAAVTEAPRIDGSGDEAVWTRAQAVTVRLKKLGRQAGLPAAAAQTSAESEVSLASVHTQTEIFFLARWKDATRDDSHKAWAWDEAKKTYAAGVELEDVLGLGFALRGPFTGVMTAPIECEWDVWQWKAARTNPGGHAMDKHHVHSLRQPENGKAKSFKTRSGEMVWIARLEDAGDSAQATQQTPAEFQGPRVPQYVPGKPSRSAADVRARGEWNDGQWCLELARKLETGSPDDTPFKPGATVPMAVSVFDHCEDMEHSVSKVLHLKLQDF
ncbi:MAG: hypothetical protein HYU36_15775 [Planctomycetes bacterium]|nr:hypothetical protein [Planctomycetota bacterium]